MSVGRICVRIVHVAEPGESARAAARRMAEHGVGTLIVVDPDRMPAGMLTDRDLAVRVLAEGRDPDATTIEQVMSKPPVTVSEETPIEDALRAMVSAAVRRLVVLDRAGRLAGILALDDVIDLLAEETEAVGRLLSR